MKDYSNKINPPLLAKLASEFEEYNQMLPKHFIDFETWRERYAAQEICKHCHFPVGECDCSRYDSEGNEL